MCKLLQIRVLKLYPKGDVKGDGKWLSLYLHLDQSETLKESEIRASSIASFRPTWIQSRDTQK